MDMTASIEAKSDQQNAEDYLSGPRTVTIDKVTAGNSDQPVNVHLVEHPGKPYRPSKSMRRVMVAAWGPEASNYAGRKLTLYRDPEVAFGGMKVGGIKISAMSHIDSRLTVALTVKRGQKAQHTVQPLVESAPPAPAPEPTAEQVSACTSVDDLRAMWNTAGPEMRALIEARRDELTGGGDPQ